MILILNYLYSLHNTRSKGFTVLEVLVALALLAVVIASASSSLVTHQSYNHDGEVRSEAAIAAQTVLDEIRQLDIKTLPTSGFENPRIKTLNSNRPYSVVVTYCANLTLCSSNTVRHLSVEVKHRDKVVYNTETVFTDLGTPGNSTGTVESPVPSIVLASPSPSTSPSRSPSASPSTSPSSSRSSTPSASISRSPSPSASSSASASRSGSPSSSTSAAPSQSRSANPSVSRSPAASPSGSASSSRSSSPSRSRSPSPSASRRR